MNHLEKWNAYAEARANAEHLKQQFQEADKARRAAEAALVEAMLDDEVSSWTDTSGANISMRRQFNIACNQDNAQEVEDWLQLTYGDAAPFKKTSIDKAAVTAKIKEEVESEQLMEDHVPDFFNLSTRPTIAVRGWESKKAEMNQ